VGRCGIDANGRRGSMTEKEGMCVVDAKDRRNADEWWMALARWLRWLGHVFAPCFLHCGCENKISLGQGPWSDLVSEWLVRLYCRRCVAGPDCLLQERSSLAMPTQHLAFCPCRR